jgi:hypothetical protein
MYPQYKNSMIIKKFKQNQLNRFSYSIFIHVYEVLWPYSHTPLILNDVFFGGTLNSCYVMHAGLELKIFLP